MLVLRSCNFILFLLCVTFSIIGSSLSIINIGINISIFRILFVMLMLGIIIKRRVTFNKRNFYSIRYFFAWLGIAVVSICWSIDLLLWLKGLSFLIVGIVFVIFAPHILCLKRKVYCVINLIVKIFIIITFMCIVEVFMGVYFFHFDTDIPSVITSMNVGLPLVCFYNVNDLSMFLNIGCFLCLAKSRECIGFYLKKFYLMFFFASIAVIFIGGSRGGIIGFMIGIYTYIMLSSNYKNIKKVVWLNGVCLGLSSVLIVYCAYFFFEGITLEQGSSNYVRLNLIKNGISMILNTYGFGVGAGQSAIADYHIFEVYGLYQLHNWWVHIFAEYGVLIGVGFIVYFVICIKRLFQIYRFGINKIDRDTARCFICILMAQIVTLISPSNVFTLEWIWVYWGVSHSFIAVNSSLQNQR